jgi:hypothetical protein
MGRLGQPHFALEHVGSWATERVTFHASVCSYGMQRRHLLWEGAYSPSPKFQWYAGGRFAALLGRRTNFKQDFSHMLKRKHVDCKSSVE